MTAAHTLRTEVVIVGGGVAGLACATELARHRRPFILLEKRKKLGGRATSFRDVKTGLELDNCQHVTLGCCTAYRQLLHRLSADDQITWQRDQYWLEKQGRLSILSPSWLPCPGQFTPSLVQAKFLTFTELTELSLGMLAVLNANRASQAGRTFASFLDDAGQGPAIRRKFWQPVVVSACNLTIEQVDASCALKPFLEGFLASRDASMIGIPRGGLGQLYQHATHHLFSPQQQLLLGASAARITDRAVTLDDGRVIEAQHVIVCTPFERTLALVDPALAARDRRFAPMHSWRHSPIIGVHLGFAKPLSDLPNVVLVDAPHGTQWLFFKSGDEARSTDGQTTWTAHAVISAADAWVDLPEDQIAQRVMEDMIACMPSLSTQGITRPLWHRVIKERRATFAADPAFFKHRPAITGESPLLLAADYVDQDWPSTMEGAARAGFAAAQIACNIHPQGQLELPPAPLYWLLRRLSGQTVPRHGVLPGTHHPST